MANIRRWMADARRLEEAGDVQGAISLFQKALTAQEQTIGFADLSLYNGLGDLYMRAGEPAPAVRVYEKAVEHCSEQQLYANGIAVCKKILRNAPGHYEAHRMLGTLQSRSGLDAQARQSYSEYCRLAEEDGQPVRATEALEDWAGEAADEWAVIEYANRLLEDGDPAAALAALRSGRDRRETSGRAAVEILRRIQEVQNSHDIDEPAPPPEEPANEHLAGTAGSDEFDQLIGELNGVMSSAAAPERYRLAMPIVEHLLELQPERFELLHRKLGYAFALQDEDAIVDAFVRLGEQLDGTLRSYSLRTLLTSSEASGKSVPGATTLDVATPAG